MLDSKVAINLDRGNVYFKELSFYEYKNICKMLLSNDIRDINECLETILNRIESNFTLNILEKFECLINVRNSILGNELSIKKDEIQINYDLKKLLANVFTEREFVFGDCVFKTPQFFIHDNVQHAAADYLYIYKNNIIYNESIEQKIEVLNALDIPIIKIVNEIEKTREDNFVEILDNQARINVYDEAIVLFIKAILNHDLMDLYNFEYQLLRHLNIKGKDLQHFTYPELKININFFMKEKEEEKENSSNSQPIE